jgi:hypothetical protein
MISGRTTRGFVVPKSHDERIVMGWLTANLDISLGAMVARRWIPTAMFGKP